MATNEYKIIDFNFAWKIERFFNLFENCDSIESPTIALSPSYSIYFTLEIGEDSRIILTVHKNEDVKVKLSECDVQLRDTGLTFATTIQNETNKWILTPSEEFSVLFRASCLDRHLALKCHMFFGEVVTQPENSDFDTLDLLKLSRDIRRLYGCQEFCDIKLQARNDEVCHVHKAILSARSPNLLKKSVFVTDALNICHVIDIPSTVFKLLLKYIYCMKIDTSNFQLPPGLLKAVDKLKLDNLKRKLSVYPNQIKLETRHCCSQISFTSSVENISSMKLKLPKHVQFTPMFQSNNESVCQSEMSLEVVKLAEGPEEDVHFSVSLRCCFEPSSNVFCVKAKTSILDMFGELNNPQEYRFQVDKTKRQSEISSLVYRISKNELYSEQDVFLPNDTLTILFDLTIYKADCNFVGSAYAGESFPDMSFDIEDRRQLSLDLEQLYDSKEYSDLILKAGGKEFHVHTIILFARAPRLLNTNCALKICEINDVDPSVLDILLRYLYTAKLKELTSGLAIRLYLAAYNYEISLLKQRCLIYVKNNLVF